MSHPSIYFIMGEASEGYTVSSLNKKITFWKLHHHTCKLGRALPPPHLDKIQKNSYFFRETVPNVEIPPILDVMQTVFFFLFLFFRSLSSQPLLQFVESWAKPNPNSLKLDFFFSVEFYRISGRLLYMMVVWCNYCSFSQGAGGKLIFVGL